VAFDALFKKYFTLVVLGLVALVAYFQASGTTALLGASLTEPVSSADPPGVTPKPTVPSSARRTAEPLIKRNPFDSVTGPLYPKPEAAVAVKDPEPKITDPLRCPVCTDIKVQIVTESDDPHWSFAALQGNGDAIPQLRRVGDTVGNREVAYIGFNPNEASPAVWLTSGSELCQALLFAKQPEVSAQPQAATAQAEPAAEAPAPKGAKPVPDDIKSKIQKISDNEFHVDRGVVDRILADQAELMRSARIVPEKKDGKVVGIRLFGIRPDTLLGTLGLQNGDRLETINGFDMASPEKALEAYARLRTAGNLNVKVNRRGQSQSIDYRIK
jgi:general secretion pathway protein C